MSQAEQYRAAEARYWSQVAGGEPAERMVHLPRLDADVRVLEVGNGPPLLFIHGGPNAGSTWAPLAGALSGFRCLVVDRPGCGMSSRAQNAPKSVRRFMGDLVEELIAEVEPTPVGLVASSFGSFAVLSHAIARPDGLPPVVHMGCPAMVPGSKPPLLFLLQTIPGLRKLLQLLDPPTLENAKKAFRQIGHGKAMDAGRIPEVHFEWYAALLRETPTRENELGLFGRVRPRDMFTPADLGQVTSPMSFFWGADDIFGQSDTARGVSEMIRGSELELLPDSGHLPWLDDPTEAGRHVTEFMARFSA